jgi:hypothetical protein
MEHYAYRSEQSCVGWMARYILYQVCFIIAENIHKMEDLLCPQALWWSAA